MQMYDCCRTLLPHNYFLGLIGKRMHYDAKNDNCRKFARNLDELIKKWYDDYLKSLEGED